MVYIWETYEKEEETEEVVGKVKEEDMGLLFANMDPIDIPAEREKIKLVFAYIIGNRNAYVYQILLSYYSTNCMIMICVYILENKKNLTE